MFNRHIYDAQISELQTSGKPHRPFRHTLTAILLVVVLLMGVTTAAAFATGTIMLSSTVSTGTGSVVSIVDKAADSVVEISTEYRQVSAFSLVTEGAGSGVVLTSDGYIVTNNHVIDGADTINVTLTDGTMYSAELVGTDEDTDLAVLKIDAKGLTPATFADSDKIKVGQLAVAIGNPLGELGGTVTEGIISATEREVTIENQTMTLLQTSAAVNSGNSGGGLFDSNGNLVGVVNAKSSGSGIEGLAFAIPSNTVREISEQLIAYGYVTGRPQLGISVTDYTGSYGYGYSSMRPGQSSYAAGVYITSTTSGNGLEVNDRIISIDGTEVSSSADVKNIISSHSVGDTVRVVIERSGSEVAVNVTLTEKGVN